MKKQSNLSRLLSYAGRYRNFTYASWILSAVSALIALVPFWYIWKIIKEVLEVSPNFSEAANIVSNGIWAVVFAFLSFLVYTGGLMCSHVAAFRIATNMRIDLAEHIAKLPLGFVDSFGSGRLRKIVNDSTGAAETYLAHRLPDKYAASGTSCNAPCVRLAAGTFKPCPCIHCVFDYVCHDGKTNGGKNEAI